jgi:hypothetical protein
VSSGVASVTKVHRPAGRLSLFLLQFTRSCCVGEALNQVAVLGAQPQVWLDGRVRHEQPHENSTDGACGRRENLPKGAVFQDLLFDRNCLCDGWLVIRVRLGHRHGCEMAADLIQISDELDEL